MISICFILILLISILTSSYGQVTCASGWVEYGGSCYLLFPYFNSGSQQGTWDQCNAYCSASYSGASMLCINNAAENDWLWSKNGYFHIWIGYTDMLPYGGGKGSKQYGWITGSSSTYTNWGPGQPDNSGDNEDYAVVYPDNAGGLWNDTNPQGQAYCGCEYNPALTTTPSFRPSTVLSSYPSVAPSSDSTSSPTAIPSFEPSEGSVSE